jgi:phospholipid/cholesterol/gamma-HCH transport system permease protein
MKSAGQNGFWSIQAEGSQAVLFIEGQWDLARLQQISEAIAGAERRIIAGLHVDGAGLASLDTAGAMMVLKLAEQISGQRARSLEHRNFRDKHIMALRLVEERLKAAEHLHLEPELGLIERIGRAGIEVMQAVLASLNFLGESTSAFVRTLLLPTSFRVKEFFTQLEQVCVNAIGVVSLVTFLIGVVVAYLLAMQVEKYGANIFIVNGVSLAMCRELSPILVAIIMAGRSGSAFTAQIGAMKLNEEIDALITLGLSPTRVLVIPRVAALVIAMPLLVFVGDVVGIIGGIVIAQDYLGIMPATFLDRLRVVLPLKHVLVGMGKAPVFALFVALIGCRMGLSVENNARSVGLNTTSTVVQSIVVVILLNAAFAVVFAELGI